MIGSLLPRWCTLAARRDAEQSGNNPTVIRRNAEFEGVAGRVELHTGDMQNWSLCSLRARVESTAVLLDVFPPLADQVLNVVTVKT